MHPCTHTQTWSNLNNELLVVMGKHCEQSYTQQHTFNLYLCMWEKKQRECERERESTTSMSGTTDLHQLVCRYTVATVYSSSVEKLPTSSNTWGHSYWNQQGCRKCKNQLLSIKSTGNCVDVPSSHSKSFLNYLHPPTPPIAADTDALLHAPFKAT